MTYGTVQVGRLILRETVDAKADIHAGHGERTLSLSGQESYPPLTVAQLRQRQEDLMTMRGSIQPIIFRDKSYHNGYYKVVDTGVAATDWQGEVVKFDWTIRAEYIGPDTATDIESRLTGISRFNDFGQTGAGHWHAPSVGATSYYTSGEQPAGTIVRSTTDGNINVYSGLPTGINPRWQVSVTDYLKGRSRVIMAGQERTGTNMQSVAPSGSWELNNGLLKLERRSGGGFTQGVWNGTAWESKNWNVSVGSSATNLGDFDVMAVIRNDFEMVTLRLTKSRTPGRTDLDLTLRRGSRFIEGFLQTDFSTTIGVGLNSNEASTAPASGGYVVATSNDADGNRTIFGTARTFVSQLTRGGLHKTATTSLDFYVGSVFAGGSAQTGDAAADLQAQYIGAMAEVTIAVRR